MHKRKCCPECKRPTTVCYCHTITSVNNTWPVVILQHPSESKHPIGTARIAQLSLSRCVLVEAERFNKVDLQQPDTNTGRPLLVYPSDDADDIGALIDSPPSPLIFIDASWRKSYRILQESPDLQVLPKVGIQPLKTSRYRIRKSSRSDSLSTLEAVVQALSVLENSSSKYQILLRSMDWMIEKQMALMGEEVFRRNYQ